MFIRSSSSQKLHADARSMMLPALIFWIGIPGALFVQADGVYNVQTYGATGDGATDNATVLNSVFRAAAATCGVVYFPAAANSYVINSQITWPACVSIRGDGPAEVNAGSGFAGSNIQVSGHFIGILAQSDATPVEGESAPSPIRSGGNASRRIPISAPTPSYPKQGVIEEISFTGANGAISAFQIIGRSHVVIRHVFVGWGDANAGFSRAGMAAATTYTHYSRRSLSSSP